MKRNILIHWADGLMGAMISYADPEDGRLKKEQVHSESVSEALVRAEAIRVSTDASSLIVVAPLYMQRIIELAAEHEGINITIKNGDK